MIGHTKSAAGVAGLIKVALALHHKVLPPTLHVTAAERRSCARPGNPFFVNTEPRPWIAPGDPDSRGAPAVSSFGFGGTNFHAVVEEYDRSTAGHAARGGADRGLWPAELAVWTAAPAPSSCSAALQQSTSALSRAPDVLAARRRRGGVPQQRSAAAAGPAAPGHRGVARSPIFRAKVAAARAALAARAHRARRAARRLPRRGRASRPAKIAFLFPGPGLAVPGHAPRAGAAVSPRCVTRSRAADRVTAGSTAAPPQLVRLPAAGVHARADASSSGCAS